MPHRHPCVDFCDPPHSALTFGKKQWLTADSISPAHAPASPKLFTSHKQRYPDAKGTELDLGATQAILTIILEIVVSRTGFEPVTR